MDIAPMYINEMMISQGIEPLKTELTGFVSSVLKADVTETILSLPTLINGRRTYDNIIEWFRDSASSSVSSPILKDKMINEYITNNPLFKKLDISKPYIHSDNHIGHHNQIKGDDHGYKTIEINGILMDSLILLYLSSPILVSHEHNIETLYLMKKSRKIFKRMSMDFRIFLMYSHGIKYALNGYLSNMIHEGGLTYERIVNLSREIISCVATDIENQGGVIASIDLDRILYTGEIKLEDYSPLNISHA
jgi:hypothetical protein